jgi:hypothetical protein
MMSAYDYTVVVSSDQVEENPSGIAKLAVSLRSLGVQTFL